MRYGFFVVFAAIGWAQTRLDLTNQARNVDFSNSQTTRPVKIVTALPAACNVGEMVFKSDGPVGSNIYGCVATNTWALQSGGGGSSLPALAGSAGKVLGSTGTEAVWISETVGSGLAKTVVGNSVIWSADSAAIPFLALNNAFLGDNAYAGRFTETPALAQTVTAGSLILAGASVLPISAATSVTMTSAPTIEAGLDGQRITLVNTGANAITLQDRTVLPSSGLCLNGSANQTLPAQRAMELRYMAGTVACWIQLAVITPGGGGTHAMLSATHTDSVAGAVARGDLMVGQGTTPQWNRLPLGTSGQYLRANGTDAAWSGLNMADAQAGVLAASRGGTGQTAPATNTVLVGDGADWLARTLPNCTGGGNHLNYDTTTRTFSCSAVAGGGGGASVMGGVFAAAAEPIPAATVEYLHPAGNGLGGSTAPGALTRSMVMPRAGTVSALYLLVNTVPASGGSMTCGFEKSSDNGVIWTAQALSIIVAPGSGTGTKANTTDSFATAEGDYLRLVCNNTNAAAYTVSSVSWKVY
jgi:hypothetical protein